MNDDKLKQMLAKMLPDTVKIARGALRWNQGEEERIGDTELLHLCALAEAGLTDGEAAAYFRELDKAMLEDDITAPASSYYFHATWQQRTAALAKVKGVTP